MVEGGGFEPPKLARQIYSLIPLATREPLRKAAYCPDRANPCQPLSPKKIIHLGLLSDTGHYLLFPSPFTVRHTTSGSGVHSRRAHSGTMHGVLSNTTAKRTSALVALEWSWREESNPRPADYKSAALPTELRQPNPDLLQRAYRA